MQNNRNRNLLLILIAAVVLILCCCCAVHRCRWSAAGHAVPPWHPAR